MKKLHLFRHIMVAILIALPSIASAQLNLGRVGQSIGKAAQAATLTDAQMVQYVQEYIQWMDEHNHVLPADDPYVIRLNSLSAGLTSVEGIPLNFKVYNVVDVNAFACADGSIRVFAGLMDIMSDEELLGVIGHEIGHVAHKDSKKAFRQALLTSALLDGVASTGSKAASLTDSQLGSLGEALVGASYSKKQENAADDYGYEFLASHGKNPVAMALSFRKLKELQGENAGGASEKINQLFSSHPDLDKRIRRMEDRARRDGHLE